MSEYQQQHNVSVRLDESDYKKLKFLHDKYNKMSYGKVSLADVLRTAINIVYEQEMTINKPVEMDSNDSSNTVTHEVNSQSLSQPSNNSNNSDEVIKGQTTIDQALTIEQELEVFEKELREQPNSKGKPYAESYIKKEIDKKRKELEEQQATK